MDSPGHMKSLCVNPFLWEATRETNNSTLKLLFYFNILNSFGTYGQKAVALLPKSKNCSFRVQNVSLLRIKTTKKGHPGWRVALLS